MEILCLDEVHITGIIKANDGFVVPPLSEVPRDKIFTREVKNKLEQNGFSPLTPAEVKVKKSVILTKVDDFIYDNAADAILEELSLRNHWIGDDKLDSVYKFPNFSTIKVTFSQTALAKICTETILRAYGISNPYHEIRQETYIPIRCCMKCYALELHNTRECPKSRGFKIYSESSNEGHLYRERE